MVVGGVVHEFSDEELPAAIAAVPATYRRRVAKVTGVGVRQFSTPEDVADFVANVFLEVMESAGSYDPRHGSAVAWLYGLAGNVAAGACRRRLLELVRVDGLNTGAAAKVSGGHGGRDPGTPQPSRW
jgi:DNA-directed RNA polymerase specialized sigma24 family protein